MLERGMKEEARRVGVEFKRGNIWDHRKRLLRCRVRMRDNRRRGNITNCPAVKPILEERKIWELPQQVEGYLEGWRCETRTERIL